MGLKPSTVSHHIKILRDAGLIKEETDGATKLYTLPQNISREISEALKELLP